MQLLPLVKGSLILADYTAKVKGTDEIFASTREKNAKGIAKPKLVAVGEGWVLKGLDESLATMSSGEQKAIEIQPDKAFGARDPRKVRMIPLRKLGEDAEKVSVGDTITIDDREGTIRYIGSGRVQIDYNHRLAGKTIIYDLTVTKLLESDEERSKAVVDNGFVDYGIAVNSVLSGDSLDISIPNDLFRAEGLQVAKHFVQRDVFRYAKSIKKVRYIEEHLVDPPKQTMTKKEFLETTPKKA